LIKIAKEHNHFSDFRLQRVMIDAFKEKQLKTSKDPRVTSSLTKMLLFESTRLMSNANPEETKNFMQFDIAMH
jgi:hypothetical protein